jgi:tetratricopeptide (TPR) repeat protein
MINARRCTICLLVVSFLVIPALLPAHALLADQLPNEEKVLSQAHALIEKGELDKDAMHEAITLLVKYEAQFPQEPRFPIYLAEAHYKMAEIDREFPLYEKVETYAEKALKLDPNRPEGHYWYGLFLLKKAQKAGGIRAYFFVRSGIKELEIVRASLPVYDHAGASRVLALLYCVAPDWTPFGDVDKSVRFGEEAIRIDPSYPLNHLSLADAYSKRGDKELAANEYRRVLSLPARSKEEREKARQMLMKLGVAVPE